MRADWTLHRLTSPCNIHVRAIFSRLTVSWSCSRPLSRTVGATRTRLTMRGFFSRVCTFRARVTRSIHPLRIVTERTSFAVSAACAISGCISMRSHWTHIDMHVLICCRIQPTSRQHFYSCFFFHLPLLGLELVHGLLLDRIDFSGCASASPFLSTFSHAAATHRSQLARPTNNSSSL